MDTTYPTYPGNPAPDRAARGYGHVHRSSLVEGASPHELVRLLLDGAVASLGAAQALDPDAPESREARRRAIGRALGFVQELQGSLRDPGGDDLSGRLFSLYGFVIAQLIESNRDGDPVKLSTAREALLPIAEAWRAIAPEADAADFGELSRAA